MSPTSGAAPRHAPASEERAPIGSATGEPASPITSAAAAPATLTAGTTSTLSTRSTTSAVGVRGEATRRAAQQVALELFTSQGYEATSLRQIADRLGINKASLYYYFSGKEAILRSLFDERGTEAEDLLAWLRAQPPAPDLVAVAVMRWVDTFTADKLRGIRFLTTNPLLMQHAAGARGVEADAPSKDVSAETSAQDSAGRIGDALSQFADELAHMLPVRDDAQALLVRMAVLSINAAVHAAVGTTASDEVIIAAAHRAAAALIREVAGKAPSGARS